MKKARFEFQVREDFEPGDCIGCPLGSYTASTGSVVCCIGYQFDACPLTIIDEGVAATTDLELETGG